MKWLLVLASLLVLSSCASRGGHWEKMDSNGDGQVTKAEFNAHKDARFAKYDKDGNGTIDASELPKCKKACKKKCGDKSQCKLKGNHDCKKSGCKSGQCKLKSGQCKLKKAKAHKAGQCTNAQCQLHKRK